jgi:FKBP-type peptidyl-prolyl cis-trans isomerase FkpA
MMRILLATLAVSLFLTCAPELQSEKDRETILQYIEDNNLAAEEHESGLFYVVEDAGGDDRPSLSTEVEVRYTGRLTDGTVFDGTNGNETIKFRLSGVIPGWQIGIPLFGRGGKGQLIIPSGLAYGPRRIGSIPPNSVLVFDVELVNF